jgi:DNA-binding NarL/FixJ family response regulator
LIRLLLVDDNPAMLETLVGMLQADFDIVGTLSSGASVLEQYSKLNPGVILLDVSLGDMTGFQVAERLRWRKCPAKIIFLSVHEVWSSFAPHLILALRAMCSSRR